MMTRWLSGIFCNSSPSAAIDNLAKVPGGLWALIFLVVGAHLGGACWVCFFLLKKKEGEKPKMTLENP